MAFGFTTALAIFLAAEAGEAVLTATAEGVCVSDTMPSAVRQTFVDAIAESGQAGFTETMRENTEPIREAFQSCAQRFEWSQELMQIVGRTFEFDLRLRASQVRLRATGVSERGALEMFNALPESMHEAIFGNRPMTPEEMKILQAGFEPLVTRLDGPDGGALSEYVTARAGFTHYSRALAAR